MNYLAELKVPRIMWITWIGLWVFLLSFAWLVGTGIRLGWMMQIISFYVIAIISIVLWVSIYVETVVTSRLVHWSKESHVLDHEEDEDN